MWNTKSGYDMMDMSSEVDGVRKSRVDQNLVDPNTGNWACSTFDLEKIRKGAYSVALQSVSLSMFSVLSMPPSRRSSGTHISNKN